MIVFFRNKVFFSFFVILFFVVTSSYVFAQRVVSLLPSYTEIIFELGAGDKLVGVTNFCKIPDGFNIQRVGDYLNPNIELIYKIRPDIIFVGEWKNNLVERFAKKKSIKVVIIPSEKDINDIYKTINIIAKHLNKEVEAKNIIKRMRKEIERYSTMKSYKKVYIEIDRDMWTCGKDSFISDVISKAGGINIFNDVDKSYFKTSWEEVIKRNPDVIIILSGEKKEDFITRNMIEKIAAYKNSMIYELSQEERDLMVRPTPSVVNMITKLNKYLSNEDKN